MPGGAPEVTASCGVCRVPKRQAWPGPSPLRQASTSSHLNPFPRCRQSQSPLPTPAGQMSPSPYPTILQGCSAPAANTVGKSLGFPC